MEVKHIIFILVGLNAMSSLLFVWDKIAAKAGLRRVPEAQFIGLALLGAGFGLKLMQPLIRHKTSKQPFGRNLNKAVWISFFLVPLLLAIMLNKESIAALIKDKAQEVQQQLGR